MFFEYIPHFDWYCHFKGPMYVNKKMFYEFPGLCILGTLIPVFIAHSYFKTVLNNVDH